MSWQQIDIWLVYLMVPFATLFPLAYGIFWRWNDSAQGRAILTLAVGLGLLVDFSVFYKVCPTAPGRDVVAAFVYSVILLGFVAMNAVMVRTWRKRDRRPRRSS